MLAYYAQIKAVHVAAVLLSGGLFITRGLLVQSGLARWAMATPVRYTSYGIDTVLLTAALMLATALPSALFANHWLSLKIVLLVVYIGLGTLALRRAGSPRTRALCFAAAVSVYVFIMGIAHAHHPLGWLAPLAA